MATTGDTADPNGGSQITATPKGRKLTEHAKESLPRHGFKEPFAQVDDIIDNPTRVTKQADGATVYIQRAGPRGRKYNVVIEGDEGIVTGLRNLGTRQLQNLGKNNGFDPNP
jgi:filamentous hemagglutinin